MSAQYPIEPVDRSRPPKEPRPPLPWDFIGGMMGLAMPLLIAAVVILAFNGCLNSLHETYLSVAYPQVSQAQARQRIADAQAQQASIERQRASDAVWEPRIEQAKGIALTAVWVAFPGFLGLL